MLLQASRRMLARGREGRMRKDLDRDVQHVGLPTACAVIYARVMGNVPSTDPAVMQDLLNGVAHAVSNVVPIYSRDATDSLPTPIAAFELVHGKFSPAPHAFPLKDRTQL